MAEDNFFAKQIEALEEIQTDLEKSITSSLKAIDIRQKVLTRVKGLIDKLKDGNGLTPEDILETDAVFNEMSEMMKQAAKDELNDMMSAVKRDQEKKKKADNKKTDIEEKKPEQHEAPEEGAQQVEFFDDGTFIVMK